MTKRFRALLSILLPCLLIVAQQVGFAHALSHAGNPAVPQAPRSDTQHPAEKACAECLVFAQLGVALSSAPAQAVPLPPHFADIAVLLRSFDPEFTPAFLSRAPPFHGE